MCWGRLGMPWGVLVASCVDLGRLGGALGRLGADLGRVGSVLGGVLGLLGRLGTYLLTYIHTYNTHTYIKYLLGRNSY